MTDDEPDQLDEVEEVPAAEPQTTTAEATDADLRREDQEKIISYFETAFHALVSYQQHQTGDMAFRMSLKCMALALGFPLAAGAESAAEIAKQCGMSKQCVTKCLNAFIEKLQLSPLPGQRDEESRERMAEARRDQLHQ